MTLQVVPGRPSADGLSFWVLSLDGVAPKARLAGPSAEAARVAVLPLTRATDDARVRRLFLVACDGLQAASRYRLTVSHGGLWDEVWSRTLPARIATNEPFTVALGSCFCLAKNRGIDSAYPPKLHDTADDPIRFRLLSGDQIYMDLSERSAAPILVGAPDPHARYLSLWGKLAFTSFLRQSPNLTLADDHEFWNDYPHKSAWLTWSESSPGGALGRRMDRAFALFQVALNLAPTAAIGAGAALPDQLGSGARTFSFRVPPLDFFVLDTRTGRTRFDAKEPHFAPTTDLDRAIQWVHGLTGPGVLALSQPMVERAAGGFSRALHTMGDVNLPDYGADFRRLWEALLGAEHDVVILTGDIHWTRLYQVPRRAPRRTSVWEVVSSPLALIPGKAPDIGGATGKVEWSGGHATWNRLYANNAAASYTTATFTPRSGHVQLNLRTWVPSGNADARLFQERQVVLS